jgi:hypothetical protein
VADTRRQLLEQPGPILFDEGSHLVTDHVDVRLLDEAPDLFERQCHGNSDSSAVRGRLASSDETDIV